MYRRPAKAAHHQPDRFSVSRWGALRYNGVKESNMALPSSCAIPRFWGESLAFAALVFLFKTCWITLKQVTPLTSSWSRSRLFTRQMAIEALETAKDSLFTRIG